MTTSDNGGGTPTPLPPEPPETSHAQEPAVELVMEVIETSSDTTAATTGMPATTEGVVVTMEEAGNREAEPLVETMEYAISQVVSGDLQDQTSPLEVTSADLPGPKSAFVTLFDPSQRDSIVACAEETSISQASRRFKVPATTIKKWMNASGDSAHARTKFNSPGQGRKLSYAQEKDERIASHIREMVARGEKVSMQYVCNYAKNIIREECPNFVASSGWAQRFLVRHAIDIGTARPAKRKNLDAAAPETNRGRPLSYSSATDKAIADYVKGRLSEGQHMTSSEIRKYAKEVISRENPGFTGSASWAQNFLLRHKIALQSSGSSVSSFSSPIGGVGVGGASSSVSPPPPAPAPASPHVGPPLTSSSSSSLVSSISPSLSDASLVGPDMAPPHAPVPEPGGGEGEGEGAGVYIDASLASLENVVEDSMKTALAILTGENIDLTMLSTAQVAALQTSLSELTSEAVSLVDLLSSSGGASGGSGSGGGAPSLQDPSVSGEQEGVALMTSGLESPSSGNVYLNLGGGEGGGGGGGGGGAGEGFGSALTGPAATQVNPNTQTPPPSVPTAEHIPEVVAQGSRPLSYAKETDHALAAWVQCQQAQGKKVTFASLRAYAKQLIASENPNFTASVGWVTPFLLRHNLDLNVNKGLKQPASKKSAPRRTAGSKESPAGGGGGQEGESGVVGAGGEGGRPPLMVEEGEDPSGVGLGFQETHPPPLPTATVTPEALASAIASTFAEAVLAQQQQHQQIVLGEPPAQDSALIASQNQAAPTITDEPLPSGAEVEVETKKPKKAQRGEKVRSRHTLAEKLEVVQLMKEHGMAAHYVCRMLGIANSTYAGWTKLVQQKGAELQALSANKKRANVSGQGRPLSYSREKDEQIAQWVKNQKELGLMVTPAELAKHATLLISQENPNFTASSGWQQKFLQRHGIYQLSSPWGQQKSLPPSVGVVEEGGVQQLVPPAPPAPPPAPAPAVLETAQNIPTPVQTEEVLSNSFSAAIGNSASSDRPPPPPPPPPHSEEVEQELAAWVRERQAAQETVSVQALCRRAEDLVCKDNEEFVASLGWAFRFLHRHSLMLDPRPSSSGSGLSETSRKRSHAAVVASAAVTDSSSPPDHSRFLNTPKRARQQLDPTPETTVSPSTGNLCEALLALSNHTAAAAAEGGVVGGGGSGGGDVASSQVLQAAMQNLHTVMQQALQQQQQQQQLSLQQEHSPPATTQPQLTPLPQTPAPPPPPPPRLATTSQRSSSSSKKTPPTSGYSSRPGNSSSCDNYFGKPARDFTSEEKEEVVRYANATTLLKAAIKYGVAAPTVWRWRVELKLHQPKYTAMQKKYIIKFAETNSLKEASQRYGITSKTIQNWRRGLQAEGDLGVVVSSAAAAASASGFEDPHTPISSRGAEMLDTPPSLRVSGGAGAGGGEAEVVTYDNQNFQFIVDGGEVSDTGGGGRGNEQGGVASEVAGMRVVDPVPLEVTSEVDIENVGMEYDVISSEGHAAKPRCTAHEKMQILQYAIEHSVREASQKYGISPGTLYYWKKTSTSSSTGGGGGSMGGGGGGESTSLTPLNPIPTSDARSTMMNIYSGSSGLILEQIQGAGGGVSGGDCTGVGGAAGVTTTTTTAVTTPGVSVSEEGAKEYLTSDVVAAALPPGSDVNFLQAVSSLLNSAESAAAGGGGGDGHIGEGNLSPRSHAHGRSGSIGGVISSPTDVLVTPLQVASEEMTTTTVEGEGEESRVTMTTVVDSGSAGGSVSEQVLEVEVGPRGDDTDSLKGVVLDDAATSGERLEVAAGVVISDEAVGVEGVGQEEVEQEIASEANEM